MGPPGAMGTSGVVLGTEMCDVTADNTGRIVQESTRIIEEVSAGDDQFSAVSDSDFGTHLVYRLTDGTVSEAYCPPKGDWTKSTNIFNHSASYPTLTVDDSTNNIYAFAFVSNLPVTAGTYIAMKIKTAGHSWKDGSVVQLAF